MEPAPLDLDVYRGDDYSNQFTFTDNATPPNPLNVSTYTIKAEIRDTPEGGPLRASFAVDMSAAATGIVTLSLAKTITKGISDGTYAWDLQVDTGITVQTWLKGVVTFSGDVTNG